ncbi:PREDICTED: CCA tRNA nucleotidyltransferase 1, mitochondrial [Rhagoletis zephyria]|uniref:CCA tRNA nucleotidyltransferase 1, mitochondrial n=1 Tax=Rhagoletis zephyria TaxID=28612 RepID=UPI0008112F87|nr:PREDICTED: CCA tRNA nucleotidyltransferase 1, mitochondrial [Rhagoletis zephyria]
MQNTFHIFCRIVRTQLKGKRILSAAFSTNFARHMSPGNHTTEATQLAQALQANLKPLGVPSKMRADPAFKKIDTPEFQSIFTEELRALIDIFKRHNYELRIAGGAVRDIVMGLTPKDIDLATTATPDQMKEMFSKEDVRMINAKGEKHGTITPRIHNKENFEVTTLRIDVLTDGRHAEVQFTTDWQLDANRRDLTINSMFLGFDGTLYDYFYGFDDLLQRRVVFVGDPNVRIKEDYLRILRYFRFYGRIAREPSKHDAETLRAIRENVGGLARISGERIWTELQKIVVGNFGFELVQQMIAAGLAPYCGLPAEPNIDEFKRLCEDLANYSPPHLPILYLIALLHTSEDAMQLHQRLKLSAYERDLALFITQNRHKVDADFRTLRDFQRLCLQPYAKREYVEELLKYTNKFNLYHDLKSWKAPRFPLSGSMLKERGLAADKRMGVIMTRLRSIWIDSDFSLSGEELLEQHLQGVIEGLATPPATPNKKRKSQ